VTFLPTTPSIARALTERNYTAPTPVQTAVLADAAVDRDLLVSAQTGSGKTVAYGLAMAKELLGGADRFERGAKPMALIVAPTRELALQVQRELTWLYQYTGARVVSCVGGMDPRREQRELADGAHIVVGTPGRLCDHLRRGRLDVSQLKAVVLDEADEMLDLGFREDMEFILKTTPEQRRTLLFSATLPRGIVALAKQYQKNAFRVEVAGGEGGHADIEYRAIRVVPHDIEHVVVNVLRYFESPSALVFCATRNSVKHLQAALLERGFSVVALSGELSQGERTHALQALRDGRARVCVATDVAARGIDLPNLSLVIHAEIPNDPEVMQHRSGRTGRAGKKGVSVLLVPNSRRRRVEMMFDQAGIEAVWAAAPQAEEIRKLDQQRMLQDTLFTEPATEEDLTLARARLAERSAEDIAATLAKLYRSRLPSPEDIIDAGSDRGRSRDDRGERGRGDDRAAAPDTRARRTEFQNSVWFRIAAGRKRNAEARWLLPMICRRGSVTKKDIGAIRIYGDHSEFEISAEAAEKFSASIKRPDKEENTRIEALPGGPQGEGAAPQSSAPQSSAPQSSAPKPATPMSAAPQPAEHQASAPAAPDRGPREHHDFKKKPDYAKKRDFHGKKPHRHEGKTAHGKPAFGKPAHGKPAHGGPPRREGGAPFKPAFGKKPKTGKFHG
jgi:ATP-dependent RNA helicase DeaD